MGIVVEYAGQQGTPRWLPQAPFTWDYATFGGADPVPPDGRHDDGVSRDRRRSSLADQRQMVSPIPIQSSFDANKRYRWLFDNQTAQDHPVHLHRHTFEVVRVAGRAISGI